MNRYFILFALAVILGAIGGYYFHDGLNEKIIYERNICYNAYDKINHTFRDINNTSEVVIYGTEE